MRVGGKLLPPDPHLSYSLWKGSGENFLQKGFPGNTVNVKRAFSL